MGYIFRYIKTHFLALASVGLRALSVLLGFAITFYMGHHMGAEANGFYALIAQTALLLTSIVVGGLDIAIVRDFSAAVAVGKRPALQSFMRISLLALATTALVMAVCLIGGRSIFPDLSAPGAPRDALLLMGILFIARAVSRLTGAFLRSQKAYILGQIVETIMIPAVATLGIVLQLAPTLDAILYWTVAGGIAASVLGIVASLRRTSTAPDAHHVSSRTLVKAAVPLWGVAVSRDFGEWYGLAIVAAMLSVHDAGLYRVVMQISWALAIITLGLFSVFSPRIGAAYAKRDYDQIARLTRSATVLSAVLVLPVALVTIPFAGWTLGLIGDEFRAGAGLLQIVMIGQAVIVCTSPCGLALALTGHERVNLAFTVVGLLILLVSVPLAATYGGLTWVGAAICIVTAGRNIVAWIAVRKLLGISTFSGRYIPPPAHIAAAEREGSASVS